MINSPREQCGVSLCIQTLSISSPLRIICHLKRRDMFFSALLSTNLFTLSYQAQNLVVTQILSILVYLGTF